MKISNRLRVLVTLASVGSFAGSLLAVACSGSDDCGASATCAGQARKVEAGTSPPDAATIKLTVPTAATFVIQGKSASVPVSIERSGFEGDVVLRFAGVPEHVTLAPVTIPAGQTSGTITVAAAADRLQGKVDSIVVSAAQAANAVSSSDVPLPVFVRGPSGSIDTTFGGGLIADSVEGGFYHALTQPDGKVLAVAAPTSGTIRLVRFLTDGALDTTFGKDGIVVTTLGEFRLAHAAIDQAGAIFVHGRSGVARFAANGEVDTAWGVGGVARTGFDAGGDTSIIDIAPGPNGTLFVVEGCGTCAVASRSLRLTRLTASGVLDTTYAAPTGVCVIRSEADGTQSYESTLFASRRLLVEPDGTAYVAFATVGAGLVVKVTADGVTRTTTGFSDTLTRLALGSGGEGGLLVGRSNSGESSNVRIHRLAAGLSADSGFAAGTGVEGTHLFPLSLQTVEAGKALVAGTTFDQHGCVLQRFNANGTADTDFAPGGAIQHVFGGTGAEVFVKAAFIQGDGSVIWSGEFAGTSRIGRLWQ